LCVRQELTPRNSQSGTCAPYLNLNGSRTLVTSRSGDIQGSWLDMNSHLRIQLQDSQPRMNSRSRSQPPSFAHARDLAAQDLNLQVSRMLATSQLKKSTPSLAHARDLAPSQDLNLENPRSRINSRLGEITRLRTRAWDLFGLPGIYNPFVTR